MIIRKYAQCEECGQTHVLRVGIGSEPEQAHQFACVGCGEEMTVQLRQGVGTIYGPNATEAAPDDGAPVINLHSSFVFSKEDLHSPVAFPSLKMGAKLVTAYLAARARAGLSTDLAEIAFLNRPTVSLSAEWQDLRATWSLTRNGKTELAARRLATFMDRGTYHERPENLADWLFQFAGKLGQPAFQEKWDSVFEELRKASKKEGFKAFCAYYGDVLSAEHGQRYFELIRSYFNAFNEFTQVHQIVAAGIEIGEDRAAASTHFDATRMFYGNAFEAFSSNVEILAALNNLIADRPFDKLSTISLQDYQKLDKANRFKAFEGNAAFTEICQEADSQLRNASHHGALHFHRRSGTIIYRAGKGSRGPETELGYATYLARCVKLFLQSMVILRLELLIADRYRVRPPL